MKAELKVNVDGHCVTFTGSPEEAAQFLHKVRTEGLNSTGWYYLSESKGWMRINTMPTAHIANAIMKIYREWAANLKLRDYATPAELLAVLRDGPIDEPYFRGLFKELVARQNRSGWR